MTDVGWIKDDQPLFIDETRMVILPSGALELEQVQLIDQVDITSITWNQSVVQISRSIIATILKRIHKAYLDGRKKNRKKKLF